MLSAIELRLDARDSETAIALWWQKAEQFAKPPLLAEFSMADFARQSFRFLILVDLLSVGDSVFLGYGLGFAKLFGLPERPSMLVPMLDCIPDRYRFLFVDGCRETIADVAPIRFNGAVAATGGAELYRASFMPLRMDGESMRAVYGSFNFRFYSLTELVERQQTAEDRLSPPHRPFPTLELKT